MPNICQKCSTSTHWGWDKINAIFSEHYSEHLNFILNYKTICKQFPNLIDLNNKEELKEQDTWKQKTHLSFPLFKPLSVQASLSFQPYVNNRNPISKPKPKEGTQKENQRLPFLPSHTRVDTFSVQTKQKGHLGCIDISPEYSKNAYIKRQRLVSLYYLKSYLSYVENRPFLFDQSSFISILLLSRILTFSLIKFFHMVE